MSATLQAIPLPPHAKGLRVTVISQPPRPETGVLCMGRFDTPVGRVIMLGAGGAIWGLGFAGEIPEAQVISELSGRWPDLRLSETPEALAPALQALLRNRGDLRVVLKGSGFQMRVWRALLDVPFGQIISYGTLAHAIGLPRAARAVGTAVGQNPVAWIVPCHRVTRSDGATGGFHWGTRAKRALLNAESAPAASPVGPLFAKL